MSHRDRESSRSRSSDDDVDRKRIYVGKLPRSIENRDVEELFSSFGRIMNVRLFPARRDSTPFAFVTFEDARDASDAIKDRNGYVYRGERLRVEMPHGSGKSTPYRRYGNGRGGRSQYRVFITGLNDTASWQDLKDHMRKAGDVCFANVFRDGSGVVEYNCSDDMKYAVRKLDGTKFKSFKGDTSQISVRLEDDNSRSRSRSRSYTPTPKRRARSRSSSGRLRSRSRSRSPRRESRRRIHRHSDSRSRSRSPLKRSHRRSGGGGARYSPDSSTAERHRSR